MTGKPKVKSGLRAQIFALIGSAALACALAPEGWAMLAPAQGAAGTDGQAYDRAADMNTIQTALESKLVRERLKTLGLTDKEIESRLSRLSDRQVHQLAKDVDTLGSGGLVVELVVAVLLVLLILFLIQRL